MAVTYPIEPGKNVVIGANTVGAPVGAIGYLVFWENEVETAVLHAIVRVQDPGAFGTHDYRVPASVVTLAP